MKGTGSRFAHDFRLDGFQIAAAGAIDDGRNVLVSAPTGSGKTVIAEMAVAAALSAGTRCFYTTPIKALSNQKFTDLGAELGADSVGLLTGDHMINPDAPVVVMTTEVLRNMLYSRSPALDRLGWVVLDEVHFLQDRYRGAVWEEVLIHTPASVRFASLSATVSNATELGEWIEALRGPTLTVVEHERPVELDHLYMVSDRQSPVDHLMPLLVDGQPNEIGPAFDRDDSARQFRGRRGGAKRPNRRYRTPRRVDVVERLEEESLLPAIYFVFSRKGCDEAARRCLAEGMRLTDGDEAARISGILDDATESLEGGDLDVLGFGELSEALRRGFAPHHAGMVPAFREAVEKCFSAGLVKVVFATETLALGINMPARSVVIEQLSKFTGDGHELLTPAQFTQLTGRAGRRGIDTHGSAIVLWSPYVDFATVSTLAASREFPLRSSFRPNYNMVANLIANHSEEHIASVLGRSFAQFQADRTLVAKRSELERIHSDSQAVRTELESLGVNPRDAEVFRSKRAEVQRLEARRSQADTIDQVLTRLAPGDLLELDPAQPRKLVAVIATAQRKAGTKVITVTPRGRSLTLNASRLDALPRVVGRIQLPAPHEPTNSAFLRDCAVRLRRVNPKRLSPRAVPEPPDDHALSAAGAALEGDELQHHPDVERIVELAATLGTLERSERTTRRAIAARDTDIMSHFDAIRTVLTNHDHLDRWELTASGSRLRRIFCESDLLVSLSVDTGLMEGLDPRGVAALVSCFTHEHRGAERPPPARLPNKDLQLRFENIMALWRSLAAEETALGLANTPEPSAGFARVAYRWASGAPLVDALGDEEITGGDFVRNVRTVIDLLVQIASVSGGAVGEAARTAADRMRRDVAA
ncbi:MAG: DEAD/DEAH box helicase [Microthrixaceae bacterium]